MSELAMEPIPEATLQMIERHLHAVIRGRVARLLDKNLVPLPSLASMRAGEPSERFGPVPGMKDDWFFTVPGFYGGFLLRWLAGGADAVLESVSSCRVSSGSGQRHRITAAGWEQVESGDF